MNRTFPAIAVAAFCLTASIGTLHAQDGPPPPSQPGAPGGPNGQGGPAGQRGQGRGGFNRRNPLLVIFDTNGDGVIDADEIANASAALKKLDKNGDGKITDDELRAIMPGRGPGGQGGNDVTPMVNDLMKFDKNGDGKLSKDELPDRMKGLMDRGDTNKDGFLTRDEVQKLFQAQSNAAPQQGGDDHKDD